MLREPRETLAMKLETISGSDLKRLAAELGLRTNGSVGALRALLHQQGAGVIDDFIRRTYRDDVTARQSTMTDDALMEEIQRVTGIKWGVVQGKLDDKIQREYVRKFPHFADLERGMAAQLFDDVASYVKASWYNHWTTVLIEDHIALHPRVVPTIKKVKGVDIFFCDQPFDVKITYVPKELPVADAVRDPRALAVWLYENQGEQRFGSDNRLFIVLIDREHPEESWKLKREFGLLFERIDSFLDSENVSMDDVTTFEYNGGTYSPLSKLLLIAR